MSSNVGMSQYQWNFLETSDYQVLNVMFKKIDFSIESSSTNAEFLTEIFVDRIKPLVKEKHEFDKRVVSKRILFGNFRTIKFLMQGTESTVLQRNGLAQVESYHFRTWLDESSEYLRRNNLFDNRGFQLFRITGLSSLWRRDQKHIFFQLAYIWASRKFSIET